ncbi:MAG: 5'/3'-nucleotidase SurE, partial [Adhaeribacter sp.]
FSLCEFGHDADFSHTEEFVELIARQALKNGIPEGVALNVNFPKKSNKKIAGVKVCRQAQARWEEEFDERLDPNGRRYFWLTGNFINPDKGEDTDEWALAHNFVSIVPCQYDMTAHFAMARLNNEWELSK